MVHPSSWEVLVQNFLIDDLGLVCGPFSSEQQIRFVSILIAGISCFYDFQIYSIFMHWGIGFKIKSYSSQQLYKYYFLIFPNLFLFLFFKDVCFFSPFWNIRKFSCFLELNMGRDSDALSLMHFLLYIPVNPTFEHLLLLCPAYESVVIALFD